MAMTRWRGALTALLGLLLSFVGIRPAPAVPPTNPDSSSPLAQAACPESWQTRKTYARVITAGDPLRIRATPNGRPIGSVPRGWTVVVQGRDASGQWTKITSHFGDVSIGFASAPDLRAGWVATRFLRTLGDFCEKPMAMGLMGSPTALATPAAADWLTLGDEIARASQPKPLPQDPNP